MIFVFGSNLQGKHGKGAAKTAHLYYGAKYGIGEGFCGQSYAIPTKSDPYHVRSLEDIKKSVNIFLAFAKENSNLNFKVTRIGCGLAGYKDFEIAPLFISATPNCSFDIAWKSYLEGKRFWSS